MLRTIITAFALALPALAAPVSAQGGLQSNYVAAPQGPAHVADIAIGEPLLEKADEYGERELTRLVAWLREDLERELAEAGWLAPGLEGAMLSVTIVDATPNRPTMEQLASTPGLSLQSYGRGGARLEARLISAEGAPMAHFTYRWSTPTFDINRATSTWSDARRTFDRFSSRLAADLAEQGARS